MVVDPVLHRVLAALVPPSADSLPAWLNATAAERAASQIPVERALIGGACADRIGFAFAIGYAEALRALVPDAPGGITALCVTEEAGNMPRAIQTTLAATDEPGRYTLSGRKKWATVADHASALLVVARTGEQRDGKHLLRVVRVATNAPGVRIVATTARFIPEISHAEVELDRVAVAQADVLPGDGYDLYVKPFRTVEDLHVHSALAGYLIGVVRRRELPRELLDALAAIAVATRALALADATAATTHVGVAGVLQLFANVVAGVERAWSASPDDEWQRWQRDRALLQVASTARAARRERAWSVLSAS